MSRIKKWSSREAYLKDYQKRYFPTYRLKNKEKLNELNKLLRRKKGKMPREIWALLLKDSDIQRARLARLKHRDPLAWQVLVELKKKTLSRDSISDKCKDCEKLFSQEARCARNPDYCRSCWGERYIKKLAKNKESLLYNPSKMV